MIFGRMKEMLGANIKYVLASFFIFFLKSSFCQNTKCDCLVRYGFHYEGKREVEKYEKPFTPKKGQKFAFHVVTKDSAGSLYYIPHVYDSLIKPTIALKKQQQLPVMVEIIFNGLDSIPLYKDPNANSPILEYIKKENGKSDYDNHSWFLGCQNNFVRIMSKQNGWLKPENYKHFKKIKKS
jgi:hypothetical protein